MALIRFTNKGIYCKQGDFYIDPWKPVKLAVTTHGHADHVKWGNEAYLCHELTKPVLLHRLGADLNIQTLRYREEITINGVKLSMFPAGHVIGSAQIRLEYKGEICVISGDYKVEYDGISTAFEPVKCHTFVSESTFGLPIYKWLPQQVIFDQIGTWVNNNQEQGKTSVLIAYSLGKAQRLIRGLSETDRPIYVHPSIANLNDAFIQAGVALPETIRISPETRKEELQSGIVIVPPALADGRWIKTLQQAATGVCSGWMQVRAGRRWRSADAGFALSDHADWPGLLSAIKATEAEKVFVTHGFTATFSKYLNEIGIEAEEVKTQYGTQEEEVEVGSQGNPVIKEEAD
ncbi:putative mRNA 3-end processing factor [Pedobacter steynii]|uniref:Putative mRNA 3-end processing factor n=1 Tax=Pedobacter steynii TaxID=430522 RepID=A0A1G9PV83_9SPHI|nr:ligase-associated DNA damage response exonuclease [Pedobacter steynii]NQX38885.1 ligase-associated DNA damage response exonuclease [Pedobacter steynii]SDM02015.1 putative mRNA 3-end processing factor [Pedobacter steynii]